MAEIDVSSYPKPNAQQSNPLGIVQQVQQLQRGHIAQQQEEMALNLGRLNTLRSTLGTLVTKPDLTQQDFIRSAGQLVAGNVLPHQFIAKTLTDMPNTSGMTPAQASNALRAYAQQHLNQVMGTQERMQQSVGQVQFVQNGNEQVPVRVQSNPRSPMPGVSNLATGAPIASIPNQLGPEQRAQGVTALTPGNVPVQPRLGEIVNNSGNARPPAQVAAAIAGAPVRTGQAPGEAEAQIIGAGGGANAAVAARTRAETFTERTQPLLKASQALERLGPQGLGPTTENLNYLRAAGIALGLPGAAAWQNHTTDYETAKKSLSQYVTQNSVGQGTDQRLTSAFASSPNMQMTQATAHELTNAALSLERMKQAQHLAFERSGQSDSQYQRFVQNFNRQQDPRAYGFDLMTRAQQQRLISGLSGEDRTRFRRSLEVAADTGIINRNAQ